MTQISDIFAFAVENVDYWTELLTGADYPSELTEAETRSLDAARIHIEGIVVELLHSAAKKLGEKLGVTKIATPGFKSSSTVKNRAVRLSPPADLSKPLYRIEFSLGPTEDGTKIVLYASLVVKKGALESLRRTLYSLSVNHEVNNYYLYAPGIALTEGKSIDSLATEAANLAVTLLDGFSASSALAITTAA